LADEADEAEGEAEDEDQGDADDGGGSAQGSPGDGIGITSAGCRTAPFQSACDARPMPMPDRGTRDTSQV